MSSTPRSHQAKELATALNDVAAHRHPSHRQATEACTCQRDPLRYLVAADTAGSGWSARISTVLAGRGRVYTMEEHRLQPAVTVHHIRLCNRDMVNRSDDGIWRPSGANARHQIGALVAGGSRSVLVWLIFLVVIATMAMGAVVGLAHTAQVLQH